MASLCCHLLARDAVRHSLPFLHGVGPKVSNCTVIRRDHPLATENPLENADGVLRPLPERGKGGRVGAPHQRSLGAAPCYRHEGGENTPQNLSHLVNGSPPEETLALCGHCRAVSGRRSHRRNAQSALWHDVESQLQLSTQENIDAAVAVARIYC